MISPLAWQTLAGRTRFRAQDGTTARIRRTCGRWWSIGGRTTTGGTQERAFNELEHFRATVDGLGVHFIHERGKGPDPFPLIISHGWPGSVVEMLRIIPMLTDPAAHGGDPSDSFDVVVPSLPGYGFSDKPVDRGMSNRRIAGMWHSLMTDGLGYTRFGAQGGDWGGMISSRLGFDFPGSLAGVHVNLMTGVPAFRAAPDPPLTEAEQEFHAAGPTLVRG